MRETNDEDEDMNYMVKGRDFSLDHCAIIDVLSKPMEMNIKSQSLDQYLWSITRWWLRVKEILSIVKREIDKQIFFPEKVTLKKELFPKLSAYYEALNEEEAKDCIFQTVALLPGWLATSETASEEVESVSKKKNRVINWTERTPIDCLNDFNVFCDVITDEIDSRYDNCVSAAAHKLGSCLDLPDILSLVQSLVGRLTACQRAALDAYGNAEFHSFYSYVCSLVHIKHW